MKKILVVLLILLAAFASSGFCAEAPTVLTAVTLAELMRQANYSDGFEQRLSITSINPDGQRSVPIKLSIIGQLGAERQRLLIRGISPDNVRERFVVAERHADSGIRVFEYGSPNDAGKTEVDPFAKLFDTELVIWDMFSPWWNWPKQGLEGLGQIAGHDCTIVRSQVDSGISPIREVVSCVDKDAKLSMRTQLYDGRHKLIRTISVVQMVGKESGAMAAKEVSVTGSDSSISEAELYSGDEHYLITPETFPAFDSLPIAGK